jgi:hypothetical protein
LGINSSRLAVLTLFLLVHPSCLNHNVLHEILQGGGGNVPTQ